MRMKPSKHFDRFVDLEWLADRGPIHVYKAFHVFRYTRTILKVVGPPTGSRANPPQSDAEEQIFLEASVADRVDHPNVLRVIDAGRGPNSEAFVAWEYLEGQTLGERLDLRGALSVPQALRIAIEVSLALAAAHERKVIHGDICPDNIFMRQDGGVKLLGFGHAGASRLETRWPAPDPAAALRYLCPHYAATGELDIRSDIYSLAATLYEALTGSDLCSASGRSAPERPPAEHGVKSPLHAFSPLHEVAPRVPRALADELDRALSQRLEDRPPNAVAFSQALQSHRRALEFVEVSAASIGLADDAPTAPFGVLAAIRTLDALAASGEASAAAAARRRGTLRANTWLAGLASSLPSLLDRWGHRLATAPARSESRGVLATREATKHLTALVHWLWAESAASSARAGRSDATVYGIPARARGRCMSSSRSLPVRPATQIGRATTWASSPLHRSGYRQILRSAGSVVAIAAGVALGVSRTAPEHLDSTEHTAGSSAGLAADASAKAPSRAAPDEPPESAPPTREGRCPAPDRSSPLTLAPSRAIESAASGTAAAGPPEGAPGAAPSASPTMDHRTEAKRYPSASGSAPTGKAREAVYRSTLGGWPSTPLA